MSIFSKFAPEILMDTKVKDKVNYLVNLTQMLAIIAVIVGVMGMVLSNLSIRALNENSLEPLGHLRVIKDTYERKVLIVGKQISEGSVSDYAQAKKELIQHKAIIEKEWKIYAQSQLTEKEKELLPDAQRFMGLSLKSLDTLSGLIEKKDLMGIMSWNTDDAPYTINVLTPILNNMMQIQIKNAQVLYQKTQIQFYFILISILIIIVAGAIYVSKMVKRVVYDLTAPFGRLIDQTKELSENKLDEPFVWDRNDEIGQVGKSFELSRQALYDLFEQINIQNKELEQINQLVRSSINYASRIQRSFLPNPRMLDSFSKDAFVIWKPKDVIGGDCYWVDKTDKGFFVAIIDCTGHGVPGALMTFVVISILDRLLVQQRHLDNPARLLGEVNRLVKETLGQFDQTSESNDGMDGGFCYVDLEKMKLTFAGANTPLLYIDEGHLHHIKPDKHSIGYVHSDPDYVFTNHELDIKEGMKFYLTTDGMIDQIGGDKRIAFGKKRLMEILHDNHHRPMKEQEEIILEKYNTYKGDESQRDDNTFIAFTV